MHCADDLAVRALEADHADTRLSYARAVIREDAERFRRLPPRQRRSHAPLARTTRTHHSHAHSRATIAGMMARIARARWLITAFTAAGSSPNVRWYSGTMNSGS